jgi:DNA (cytosine-5)-methyltransferase 1
MKFGSVCSGIEAASVAWHPLGWRAAWLAEIEPFPSAVLAHHYPDVPNIGDMTKLLDLIPSGQVEAPDVFCGGTPCQAFSVAGLRKSLDDARGNLSLTFCEIADAIDHVRAARGEQPAIIFWENVPGVLNTKDNAFGCFLAGLAGEELPLLPAGGKWTNAGCVLGPQRAVAWRVLDAQYFGVAQRRRRVFVVASSRKGFDPAAVLFEFNGVRRDSAPSREAGQDAAAGTLRSTDGGCDVDHVRSGHVVGVQNCLRASSGGGDKPHVITMAHGQGGAEIGFDRGPTLTCNHEAPIAAYPTPVHCRDLAQTITSNYGKQVDNSDTALGPNIVAFSSKDYGADACLDLSPTLRAGGHADSHANSGVPPAVAFMADDYRDGTFEACDTARPLTTSADRSRAAPLAVQAVRAVPHTDIMPTMNCGGGHAASHNQVSGQMRDAYMVPTTSMQVRRLTPIECERLQGFPDNYTAIPWCKKPARECPDGPRYKALGNSWAVPNVRWIGRRIHAAVLALENANDNRPAASEVAA